MKETLKKSRLEQVLNPDTHAPVSQRSWVQIPFKPGFSQAFFHYCVNNSCDELKTITYILGTVGI